jgi:hypothetical protein
MEPALAVAHTIEQGLLDCSDITATLNCIPCRNHAVYRSQRKRTLQNYRQRSKSQRLYVS